MVNQRKLVQRIERRLENGVGDAFARMFGGAIIPQEVEALLRREAHDGVRALPGGWFLAPNDYVISLGESDFQKIVADRELTAEAFAKHLAGYIQEQGWQTYGEVVLRFEQSDGLHTGQYRVRAVVNPDARSPGGPPAPAEPNHAYTAEPGVPAMTDNPNRGGQSQGRPGDEYYGDQYGRPQEDAGAAEQHPPYPPEQGYAPSYEQGPPPQGGYPEQGYEQRPPAPGYGAPGYEQGYRPAPPGYGAPGYEQPYRPAPPGYGGQPQYGPPPGGAYPPPPADYDYGRPPAGDPGYGRYEQRPTYAEQPGYQPQGYAAPYGQPQYGQPEYGQPQYGQPEYGQPQYGQPQYGQPEYGQPQYGQPEYGQDEYPVVGAAVTLQLDDGSGRTYQLQEGANVIGRGQDAQFRLPDTGVSRRHVEVRWDGQSALLSDLNSTNGTTVNNAPVQEWQLADGDVIRVGHSEIIVRVH